MVNAAKRIRALADKVHPLPPSSIPPNVSSQLYNIRNGPASISLPTTPTPSLTRIYMRLPTGAHPLQTTHHGARDFWRTHLPRLKYYNPSLQCTVDTIRDGPETDAMYLSVSYTSPDRSTLETLPNTLPQALGTPSASASQTPKSKSKSKSKTPSAEDLAASGPIQLTPAITSHAPNSQITESPPETSPSAPQTTSPPSPLYTRTLTTPLANVRSQEIWAWVRQHTKLPDQRDVPEGELEERRELLAFFRRAEQDRQRVKRGIEAVRREEAELKKAREAAERMAADV